MSKKWYSVGISDTEEILKTNAACGLSHKAARSRVRKDGKNDFFYVKSKPMLSVLKPLISDPILILLVGVDIIAALFGKELTAVAVGTIILIHIVSLFLIYRLSCQRVTEISSSCRPKARVIRDGKLFITDSENLVRGDVILLEKGDIVPCDARMVSGNNLKVNIFAGRNSERQYVVAEPDKDAQYPADASKNFWEFRNMLYAGSVVVSGNARGIVVETGKRTYIGVLDGGIPLNDGSEHPKTLSELKSFSKIYCLLMLVAILPLTIAGIFSYGFDNIMSTFLLSVSVLISALGDLIYIIGNIITASILFKCATSEKSSALIKSAERIDTLAEIDELVLIGDSAFTDKNLRVSRAVANGKEYKGKEILDKSLIYPAELVLLMMRALNSYPSGSVLCDIDIPNSFNDYAQKLGVDASGFDVRFSLRGISFGEVTSLGVSDGNSYYEVCLSRTDKLLHLCSYERVVGENMVISSSRREEIGKFFSYFASQGFLVYTVAKCINGAYVLCGIFVIKKGTSIEARRAFANLESLGIKVKVFLNDASAVYALKEAGLIKENSDIAFSSKHSISRDDGNAYSVCVGYTYSEIKNYIVSQRRSGRKVASYDLKASGYGLFRCSDISITADSSVRTFPDVSHTQISSYVSSENELCDDGAQILRLSSDVAIPRADMSSGGVSSIYNAVLTARNIIKNITSALTYLLCSQLARVVFVLMSFLCGAQTVRAAYVLIGGLIIDIALIFGSSLYSLREIPKKFKVPSFKNPLLLCKDEILTTLISAFVGSLFAIVIYFITKTDVSSVVFASLCITQMLMLFSMKQRSIGGKYKLQKREALILGVIMLGITVLIVSFLIAKQISALTLICLPVTPLLYFVLNRFLNIKNKRA